MSEAIKVALDLSYNGTPIGNAFIFIAILNMIMGLLVGISIGRAYR